MDAETIGKNIRRLRLSRDVKQYELASQIGVDAATMCLLEKGKRRLYFDQALAITNYFNEPMDRLLRKEE